MEEIRKLVKEAVEKFNEIDDQVQWLEVEARKLPDYKSFMAGLLHTAFYALVWKQRSKVSRKTKARATKRKVNPHDDVADVIYRRVFGDTIYINGRTLNEIFGKDLLPLAEAEEAIGKGHSKNATFLRRLHPLVPAEKKVGETVPDKQLKALYRTVVNEDDEGLAMAGN